jgi:hypothetical protein
MGQVQISTDEIVEVFQQLYPEQLNRVVAEIKASKFEQMYESAIAEKENEDEQS